LNKGGGVARPFFGLGGVCSSKDLGLEYVLENNSRDCNPESLTECAEEGAAKRVELDIVSLKYGSMLLRKRTLERVQSRR
jgi:hypothetical protein